MARQFMPSLLEIIAINHTILSLWYVLDGCNNYSIVRTRFLFRKKRQKITCSYYFKKIQFKKEYKISKCVLVRYECSCGGKGLFKIYILFPIKNLKGKNKVQTFK